MIQTGMGVTGETAVTGTPSATVPGTLDQLLLGAKTWMTPAQIPAAFKAVLSAAAWSAAPMTLVGFLAVPAIALAVVMGMGAAKRRRVKNPRRGKSSSGHSYEVVVGNVGTVYRGRQGFQAHLDYNEYVRISKRGGGRTEGEPVTLFMDGEIIKEYEGTAENPRRRRRRVANPRRRAARGRRQNPRTVTYSSIYTTRKAAEDAIRKRRKLGIGAKLIVREVVTGHGPSRRRYPEYEVITTYSQANPRRGRHRNATRYGFTKKRGYEKTMWKRVMATTGHSRKTLKRHAKSYTSRFAGKRSRSRGAHRVRNGRSYVMRGQRPTPGYVPGPGKIFYLSGRKGVVKSVSPDERGVQWVQFRRAVDGATGMSLGNFRQAAYIE